MKERVKQLTQVVLGLGIMALGLTLLISVGGPDPWGFFLLSLYKHLPLSLGVTSFLGGGILVLFNLAVGKRRPGIATPISIAVVGVMIDLLFLIPWFHLEFSQLARIVLLAVGIVVMALGIAVYVLAGLGEGPVEGMMFVIHQRMKISVGKARVAQDCFFVLLGLLLGAKLGPGTFISAISVGPVTNFFLANIPQVVNKFR
jgi:uncharacterized membrane protein YczE